MTVIAFDGKNVAADRQADIGGTCGQVTKIFRVGDRIAGIAGGYSHGLALLEWYKAGHDPHTYPREDNDRSRGSLLIFITSGLILKYEYYLSPLEIQEQCWAAVCGKDLALGAMAMGASAWKAVEIASRYDAACGLGIDKLSLV